MRKITQLMCCITVAAVCMMMVGDVWAQQPEGDGRRGGDRGGRGGGFEGGRRGRGGFGGGGPGGGMSRMMQMLPIFATLDADKDGEISAMEIENSVVALKKLDKNKDGKLTEEELRPEFGGGGRGPRGLGRGGDPEARADRLLEMDANGDKKLAKNELPERLQRGFEQADKNKDDFLSREELVEMAKQQSQRGGRGGRGGFGGGRGRGDRPERPARPE